MTIMQQMNLFNTSSEVAGFKLDYLEVWNWGTFDKKVYHMNLHGNNSLLTGANASGKSTLIDALLTLMVPLKRQRFYNQSSGVEKKGNRTEESYFFGNYGNQQQEGAASTTTLRLRDKGARSVLLASFCNVDKRVVTLFQVRYYTGEELKVLFGVARESLTIERDFSEFDLHGDWRKRLTKKYNTNETKRTIEFFDGPVAYGEKMITLFGMRSDKALTLFNQIVGVKVLDDLDSFIRTNMLEELPAEEKYQELKDNFQNLMEAKTNIDKVKEQIAQLEPINALTEELKEIDIRIVEMEQEKSVAAYWFAARTVDLCDKELVCCKSDLRKLEDRLKELKVQKGELEQEQMRLTVAIEKDEVGQQIHEIEKEINQRVRIRDNRKAKAEEYDKLAKLVKMEQSPDVEVFEINRATAKREKDALQVTIDRQLMEEKRQAQNRQDEISSNIEERMATIRYLQQHKNNISGRVAEIRDEILEAVGATTEEIPFIGELICVKDDERDWEYSIERILHNFALRLVVPEKYYKQVNEYVNGHNLRGRIVYQRYQGAETIREFEDRTLKADSLLRKLEYKPMCLYLDWLEDRLFAELWGIERSGFFNGREKWAKGFENQRV
ncbi:ATP-binding protein [Phocaeicola vulgatus]|uniref:ATP-binding protein n=1 Tax=Phocaeicola vulgatus TaxID=821 RepID=UPI00321B479E